MKIYVAASSTEIERAKRWMAHLVAAGFEVVSTWPSVVADVGESNPRDARREQRIAWSQADLNEVRDADTLWFLAPKDPTRGVWVELGFAYGLSKRIVVSGDTKQSIFCALALEEFAEDMDAFTLLVAIRDRGYSARAYAGGA